MILLEPTVTLKVSKDKIQNKPEQFKQQTERVAVFLAKQNNFNVKNISITVIYNNNKNIPYVLVTIDYS